MASKKTYTIHITYTTKSPYGEMDSPQQNNQSRYNNSSSNFGMNNSYSAPTSNWQSGSGKRVIKKSLAYCLRYIDDNEPS